MTSRAGLDRIPIESSNRIGVVLHVSGTGHADSVPQSVHQDAASRSLSGNHGYMSNPRRFFILNIVTVIFAEMN